MEGLNRDSNLSYSGKLSITTNQKYCPMSERMSVQTEITGLTFTAVYTKKLPHKTLAEKNSLKYIKFRIYMLPIRRRHSVYKWGGNENLH